jgi:flavin reductase (DIM6/NTAB) family NADH-FMN oxidoreductase RutF
MSISKDKFRAALGQFASGVTVVTLKDTNERLHGITVSAFSSVSLTPPLVMVCIDRFAGSHDAFEKNSFFVVNVLREDQLHYSEHFASHLADKFAGIDFYMTASGVPVLKNALVILECRLTYSFEAGDHSIFVGEILQSSVNDGKPLVYFQGRYQKIL